MIPLIGVIKSGSIFRAAFAFPMSIKCLDLGSCFSFRLHFFATLLFHFLRDIQMLLHDVPRHDLYLLSHDNLRSHFPPKPSRCIAFVP